jgi:hypothetical protein
MALCLRCDASLFSAEQQQAFLDSFIAQLRTTIETGT